MHTSTCPAKCTSPNCLIQAPEAQCAVRRYQSNLLRASYPLRTLDVRTNFCLFVFPYPSQPLHIQPKLTICMPVMHPLPHLITCRYPLAHTPRVTRIKLRSDDSDSPRYSTFKTGTRRCSCPGDSGPPPFRDFFSSIR